MMAQKRVTLQHVDHPPICCFACLACTHTLSVLLSNQSHATCVWILVLLNKNSL